MSSRIEEIKARWASATPGPYDFQDATKKNGPKRLMIRGDFDRDQFTHVAQTYCDADAAFIAAAPEDIRWLVERVERLEGAAVEMNTALKHIAEMWFLGEVNQETMTAVISDWLKHGMDAYKKTLSEEATR